MTPGEAPGLARPRAGRPSVFDVDGVLADVAHRVHHLEGPRKDWPRSSPRPPTTRRWPPGSPWPSELAADHDLAYLTGRPERLRRVTRRWLARHGLPAGPLWMRPPGTSARPG